MSTDTSEKTTVSPLTHTLLEVLRKREGPSFAEEMDLAEQSKREFRETLDATTPMEAVLDEKPGYTVISFRRRP